MRRFFLISVIAIVLLMSLGGLRALGRAGSRTVADASAGYCLVGYPYRSLGATFCTP